MLTAELMMLSAVAISLFTLQNMYGTTSSEFFILFEFTDSVCPLGACSLILIWVILFLISHNMETFPYKSQARRRWCPAEASSPVAAQATVGGRFGRRWE